MTEASPQRQEYQFDVAVSFAGEDREYVEDIVAPLKEAGIRVFYDSDYQAEMWGEDLIEYFDDVYRVKSRYAIMFISRLYANKMWTRHERRSVLARALEQPAAYVLPVRLDDTTLEGLRPTVGYLDARRVGIDGIVAAALVKIRGSEQVESVSAISRAPRTEAERQRVLLERPPGWEYLYFGGELLHEREAIEAKYRDHEMRWADRSGEVVTGEDVPAYFGTAINDALRLCGSLALVTDPAVQERAFGAPGKPGDADRLRHLAHRWNGIYEGFIDWAARVRGLSAPSRYHNALDALARFADDPVQTYRQFVDDLVAQIDKIPTAQAEGEALNIKMTFVLAVPDAISEAYSSEMRRLEREASA